MSNAGLLESGQKIVFVGDSITEPLDGYFGATQHLISALAPDLQLTYINAGIGGNKVQDLLDRIGDDVIAHDPDWITISIGINDVWHGINGTPLPLFTDKYEELVRRLKNQTVAKLALFTTTVIGEDLENEPNNMLIAYNDFIRETAGKHNHLLVPQNEAFYKAISAWHKIGQELKFTTDGVHMTPDGDCLMALTLVKAWGML